MASEQEVIIGFTADDDTANVYSTMPVWWRKREAVGGKLERVGKKDGKDMWREYAVPKVCVKIRANRRVSEAQRQAARERFVKARRS